MSESNKTIAKRLIIGATSAIAEHVARIYAARGDALYLVARNLEKLDAIVQDLKVRGAASVETFVCDLNEFSLHEKIITDAHEKLGGIDTVLIAHGDLGAQGAPARDWPEVEALLNTNFLSPISLLTHLANLFEKEQRGTIAVITSVAGDRGRAKGMTYGTAKGGLSIFLQALRQRLQKNHVHVVTIKPGFVATPMTEHMTKTALFASPENVAQGIVKAIDKKKDVIYLPGFWRAIMFGVRVIPEWIFKRMEF